MPFAEQMPEEHPAIVKHMQGAEEEERERLESERSKRGERESKKDVKKDALMIGEEGGEGGEKEIQKYCKETAGERVLEGDCRVGGVQRYLEQLQTLDSVMVFPRVCVERDAAAQVRTHDLLSARRAEAGPHLIRGFWHVHKGLGGRAQGSEGDHGGGNTQMCAASVLSAPHAGHAGGNSSIVNSEEIAIDDDDEDEYACVPVVAAVAAATVGVGEEAAGAVRQNAHEEIDIDSEDDETSQIGGERIKRVSVEEEEEEEEVIFSNM